MLRLYTACYVLFLYLPIFFVMLFSFNQSIYIAFPLRGLTLEWYRSLLQNEGLLEALGNSVRIGIAASLISTAFGTAAAHALTRYRIPGKSALMGALVAPLVVPGIILGISLLILFSEAGVPLSLVTVLCGHVLLCTPFAMMIMISRLEGFEATLIEAARDLGDTPWMAFRNITLPLSLPGIVASLILTFTVSFDEFLLTFFLAGSEPTLPLFIWSQLRFPNRLPDVLALATIVLVVSGILVFAAEWARRRQGNPAS